MGRPGLAACRRAWAKRHPSQQRWTVYDGDRPFAALHASGNLPDRCISGAAVDELLARVSAAGDVATVEP